MIISARPAVARPPDRVQRSHRLRAYPQHLPLPFRIGLRPAHNQPARPVGRAADIRPRQRRRLAPAQHPVEHRTAQRNIDPAPRPRLPPRLESPAAPAPRPAGRRPDRGQVLTRNPLRLFLRPGLSLAGETGQHAPDPLRSGGIRQAVLPVPVPDRRGGQPHGRRLHRLRPFGQIGGHRDRGRRQGRIAPRLAPAGETAPQAVVSAVGRRRLGSRGRGLDALGVRLGQNDLGGVGFDNGGVAAGDDCGQRCPPFCGTTIYR